MCWAVKLAVPWTSDWVTGGERDTQISWWVSDESWIFNDSIIMGERTADPSTVKLFYIKHTIKILQVHKPFLHTFTQRNKILLQVFDMISLLWNFGLQLL